MPKFPKPLGAAVRRSRKQMRLSQDKLAESVGCNKRTILMIENFGKYAVNPKFSTVYSLVEFLHIDPCEIFSSERNAESSAVRKLLLLVSQCSEEEADCMIDVVQAALKAYRKGQESCI